MADQDGRHSKMIAQLLRHDEDVKGGISDVLSTQKKPVLNLVNKHGKF